MKSGPHKTAARIAELIGLADKLILRGIPARAASRALSVPHDTMLYWRRKAQCPEPQTLLLTDN